MEDGKSYVVIDLETTGFSPKTGCKIIEIAAVKIENGAIVEKRSQLIDPEIQIPYYITKLTGISNEMVIGKPKTEEVLRKFYDYIGDSIIVAHNAKFDWNTYLIHCFGEYGLYPKNEVIDTLGMSKKVYSRFDNHKLGYLCENLGIELTGAHRALGDAYATAELFIKMLNDRVEVY